ncbi:MAG TPA: energy-coupling factor transporter transmembrane component T [Candidatus Limnocylindrales bacterium]|nr:energy-coupling factor transporter transmembrane component T [Candidatus Limnocylindrales bacterium]
MSFLPAPLAVRSDAPLARALPVTRVAVGGAWLLAAAIITSTAGELVLCLAALIVLVTASGIPLRPLPRRLFPVALAALALTVTAGLGNQADADLTQPALLVLGPLRLTWPGLLAGLVLGLRVAAIALTSVLVFAPSDTTTLADSLVQQWHLPDRIAYGTVAAIGLAPLVAADWNASGAARRLRGLEPRWLPGRLTTVPDRLFVVLVAALRRAERLGLAMDARGFDSGLPRSRFRPLQGGWIDILIALIGLAVAIGALAVGAGVAA